MLHQDSKKHPLLFPRLPIFSRWLGDSTFPTPGTCLYQGVSPGQTVGMHCIFTTTQALHFCCCRCLVEGRREKLQPFLHPQGVWWVVFALSWPHQPSFLPNSHHFFSPQTYTSVNTSPPARTGHSASTIEMGSIPACVQKVSMGRTVR